MYKMMLHHLNIKSAKLFTIKKPVGFFIEKVLSKTLFLKMLFNFFVKSFLLDNKIIKL